MMLDGVFKKNIMTLFKIKNEDFKNKFRLFAILLWVSSIANAGENVIQEEKMSFDRCLKVISTSENKLSISPEISEKSDTKRVAVFTLSDGTLTITCDGEKNLVSVSTNLD